MNKKNFIPGKARDFLQRINDFLMKASVSLFAIVSLYSCDEGGNDDGATNGETLVKLVNRIDFYSGYDPGIIRTYEFRYDAGKRLSTLTSGFSNNTTSLTSTFTYRDANTVIVSNPKNEGAITYVLNSDGYIVSMNYTDEEVTFEYADGYLQKKKIPVLLSVDPGDVQYSGTSGETYTWKNGNITTQISEVKYPDLPSGNETYTTAYEYGAAQNKACSIDLGILLTWGDGDIFPSAWFGKSIVNLPSKATTQYDGGDSYATTYRYETDSDGYLLKIFKSEKQGDEPYGEEELWCIVSYE